MTPITSSAASETDKARNFTAGRSSATAAITASPPPSGRWTSSSTTSGSASLIKAAASSTDPASPTTSIVGPSSLRTPARTRRWSSTRTTRRVLLMPRHPQLALGARSGRAGDACAAAVTRHPELDRLTQPVAVRRHSLRIETDAAVAHEDARPIFARLHVHRDDFDARELRCVRHRFASGEYERREPLVEGRVAGADDVYANFVELLDFGCGRVDGTDERGVVVGVPPVQPAAQLALLLARERRDAARVVGVALYQRERLHYGVVDASRDFGSLLRPGPREPLRVSLPCKSPQPGADNRDECDRHGTGRERAAAVPERPTLVDVHGRPGDDEYEPEDESRRLPALAASARHQQHPAGDQRRRDEQRARKPQAAEEQEPGEREHRDRRCPRGGAARAVGGARRREEEPSAEGKHDPTPARERQDCEHEPDCGRVDAERMGDAAADAGHGGALVPPTDLRERRKAGRRPAFPQNAVNAHSRAIVRGGRRSALAAHAQLSDADVRVHDEPPVDLVEAGVDESLARVPSVLLAPEHLGIAPFDFARNVDGDARRQDDVQLAEADARLHARLAVRELELGEVELQLARAEAIHVVEIGRGARAFDALADPALRLDRRDRSTRKHGDGRHHGCDGPHAPGDRAVARRRRAARVAPGCARPEKDPGADDEQEQERAHLV